MSVVDFALRLAGDVSSFTSSVRTEMKSAIAAQAGVDPSAVMVTVTSGSVIVGVRIFTPPAMATSVQSAMASATSSPSSATAMLASVTGVSITVLAVVTPPIIANVAPPPPLTPSSPSPSPPPQRPPSALNGGGAISILAIAVPAAIVVLLCCLAMVCWWTRRRQVELRRADVNNWLRNMSMSTVVFQPEARKARVERAAWLAKYVSEVFMVPLTITEELTQEVKSYVRSLIPENTAFDEYYPEVVLSYATGRREQDCPGAGPGMYYAAGVVRILHECGLQCFSGLHVPVGRDWKVFMLRLKGRQANAKVLIIIKTAALYESKPCLEEINSAIELEIPLIPICFQEKNLPGRREQWAKFTDERSELMIANVQEHLGKINDIPNPGTLLNVPSTLDEIITEINKHVTIKAHVPKPKPAIQTAVMVTVTADPEPEPGFATTVPKPNSGSELELTTFNSGVKDPVSSKHAQAPPAPGVNLGKFDSRVHHPDHYL